MYFCLQKQEILHASRGQICTSSACKITCKMPVVFRYIYMRLQAIRVYSARGACRLNAGKFTCFYRLTACNAGKLRVGPFYLRTACKVTCVCRQFYTRQFYSVSTRDTTRLLGWCCFPFLLCEPNQRTKTGKKQSTLLAFTNNIAIIDFSFGWFWKCTTLEPISEMSLIKQEVYNISCQ